MSIEIIDSPSAAVGTGADYGLYPTETDLQNFLEDAGITPSDVRLDAAVAAGIDRVESRCMRHFLAGRNQDNSVQNPYARPYDPPARVAAGDWGALLELGPRGDLARLDSVIYAPQSSNPQTFSEGEQFRTLPRGAIARGRPIESMEFRRLWWAPTPQMTWNAIEITGLWGFATRIPPAVWMAMLAAGARSLFGGQFRSAAVPLGLKSWTGPGGVSQTYDYSALTARLADWDMAVQEAVNLYGRWSV